MGHLPPYDVIAARDPSAASAAASRAAILGRLTSGSGRVTLGFRWSVWRVETIRGWPLSRPTYGEFSRTLSCHLAAPEVRRSRPRDPSRTVLVLSGEEAAGRQFSRSVRPAEPGRQR